MTVGPTGTGFWHVVGSQVSDPPASFLFSAGWVGPGHGMLWHINLQCDDVWLPASSESNPDDPGSAHDKFWSAPPALSNGMMLAERGQTGM